MPASDLAYQGEITFWNTMRDFEIAEVQKLIDAWTAAHPGITVAHTAQSFDTARADYQNAAPAGSAPDILRADIGWTIGFADEGYLLDLSGLIADTDDYPAGAPRDGDVEGRPVRAAARHGRAGPAVQP